MNKSIREPLVLTFVLLGAVAAGYVYIFTTLYLFLRLTGAQG